MSGAFVPKSRRSRFELQLRIFDLNNVPLVSGTSFVKWHLAHSTTAEHRGKTNKCPVRDHRVIYDYEKTLSIRLTIGKDGMLQECPLQLEVLQEYGSTGTAERIRLGHIKLNLAEYVESGDQPPISPRGGQGGVVPDAELGVMRRYLMQDSKVNSTLKIGIYMKQTEGSREYTAPPLRTAPVFGGIAGIISSSEPVTARSAALAQKAGDSSMDEGAQAMPSLSTSNRELGEMQDVYRQTLAAHWTSLPGELRADECIEEIFAGRDGWGKAHHEEMSHLNHGGSNLSSLTSDMDRPRSGKLHSLGHSRHGSKAHAGLRQHRQSVLGEIDESEIRSDLRSWKVGEKAMT